jgi:hypothetical protein
MPRLDTANYLTDKGTVTSHGRLSAPSGSMERPFVHTSLHLQSLSAYSNNCSPQAPLRPLLRVSRWRQRSAVHRQRVRACIKARCFRSQVIPWIDAGVGSPLKRSSRDFSVFISKMALAGSQVKAIFSPHVPPHRSYKSKIDHHRVYIPSP